MPNDAFRAFTPETGDGGWRHREVTPDNDNDFPDGACRGFYVGTSGDLVVVDVTDNEIVLRNVAAGMFHGGRIKRIRASKSTDSAVTTTATDIVIAY